MKRSYSGHVPVRIPEGWNGQSKSMVIQVNDLIDDLYRRVNNLQKEVEKLKNSEEEEEGDG